MSVLYYDFECVFCGGTRSFKYFHQLKWVSAFNLNPLVFTNLLFFWSIGVFALASRYSQKANQIYDRLYNFIIKNFFIFLTLFIIFYIIQTFSRIFFN